MGFGNRVGYRGGAFLAAILTGSLVVWAAAWAWAELSVAAGFSGLAAREYARGGREAWIRNWTRLETGRILNPLRAEYPYYEAQAAYGLAEARTSEVEKGFSARASDFVSLYGRALALRPHWGRAWADLALAQLVRGAAARDILAALDSARLFAPFELATRQAELRIGLALWDRLDGARRAGVLGNVRYWVRQNPEFAVNVALSQDWGEQLRPLLNSEKDVAYLDRRLAEQQAKPVAQ